MDKAEKTGIKKLDIVLVGVGGQGTLLASRVLGQLAISLGLDVKVSEVHGMSQRGGSVTTYVRMGEKVHAPLVEQAGADYVLAFEQLEALRALPYVKPGGTLITNTQQILPMPVITGAAEYPAGILQTLAEKTNLIAVDALPLARQAGDERTVNTLLLGVLAAKLPFNMELWHASLQACLPERFRKANMAAFEMGTQQVTN